MNTSSLTLNNWLSSATQKLEQAGIGTARLDCLVLLEDATGRDRAWLLAHPEFELDMEKRILRRLESQLKRRIQHEPLAYVRGKTEFYGREFKVSKDTLEPRPETETMIDLLKDVIDGIGQTADSRLRIVDVGTGSGCLAVTAKLEFPEAEVTGTDISSACIKISRQNAKKLGADIKFYQGNLLEPLPILHSSFFILLCNLPYVPDGHIINRAAMQEPGIAIFGGTDGLDLYRRLFIQISKSANKPINILTEALPLSHNELQWIASEHGYTLAAKEDFVQSFMLSSSDKE